MKTSGVLNREARLSPTRPLGLSLRTCDVTSLQLLVCRHDYITSGIERGLAALLSVTGGGAVPGIGDDRGPQDLPASRSTAGWVTSGTPTKTALTARWVAKAGSRRRSPLVSRSPTAMTFDLARRASDRRVALGSFSGETARASQ